MKNATLRRYSAFCLIVLCGPAWLAANGSWPNWRGPTQNGTVPEARPPIDWSEDKNIKWKTEIPGSGLATPIVWGDRIFLLSAVQTGDAPQAAANGQAQARPQRGNRPGGPGGGAGGPGGGGFNREEVMKEFDKDGDGQLNQEERAAMRERFGAARRGGARGGAVGGPGARAGRGGGGGRSGPGPQAEHSFQVMALDRSSGQALWSKTARSETPHEGHHPTHGFASGSPVTDGKNLWVSFGSRGIFCFDFDGNQIWENDLGDLRTRNGFGEGASPALAGDLLLILWDQEDQSYLVALDKASGEEAWRVERDEPTSWTTPVIVEVNGSLQAIIAGANSTRSYNATTGELIWEAAGLTSNVIPTPVVDDSHVYVMSGYRGRAVQAIRLDAKGNVTDSDAISWSAPHSAPYVASPVLSEGRLYMNKSNDAYFTCFDAETGEVHYQDESLEGIRGIYASPIAANGYIYVLGKEGTSVVLKDSEKFEIVSTNKLDDPIDASPVIIGNELFIRGHKHLYCISSDS